MAVNLDKPQRWKTDTQLSVDNYNHWFLEFAPTTYRETRAQAADYVEDILRRTDGLRRLTTEVLLQHPDALEMLRMSTAPPIARDRLVGLAQVSKSLIENMERHKRVSPSLAEAPIHEQLNRVTTIVTRLIDRDLFVWFDQDRPPTSDEIRRASTIIADRLCGTLTDPLVRNAQEKRQLNRLSDWLEAHGYTASETRSFRQMQPGTFAHRVKLAAIQNDGALSVFPLIRSSRRGHLPPIYPCW